MIAYYEECSPAYRQASLARRRDALGDQQRQPLSRRGSRPARSISAAWPAQPPHEVLELGFGQGFNLAYLAARFRGRRFTGIDLTPTHPGLARQRLDQLGLKNVVLTEGDFHQLRMPTAASTMSMRSKRSATRAT